MKNLLQKIEIADQQITSIANYFNGALKTANRKAELDPIETMGKRYASRDKYVLETELASVDVYGN